MQAESVERGRLWKWPQATRHILCLGAHADDIEIGCGGTILRLLSEAHDAEVTWVVFSANRQRKAEAGKSARRFLESAKANSVHVKAFRESYFPYQGAAIKKAFERFKHTCNPDIIFTHYRQDLHQDHRLINELTWNTFRSHLILEYEIPKYDGDLGVPNMFVQLDEEHCASKVRHLMECFKSQQGKQWFTEDTFWALLRLRGVESGRTSKYAEGFFCRKFVW